MSEFQHATNYFRARSMSADAGAAAADWPDPGELGDDLPPVAAFDLGLLPVALRPLVEDVSERMQAPPDFAAASAVVALAGCVNRRATIQPKGHDSSWLVTPNLWGAIIGPPGVMKSPVVSAVVSPVEQVEKAWRLSYEAEREAYQSENEIFELEQAAWRESFKRAVKTSGGRPPRPEARVKEPLQKRLVVNDATFEILHVLLARNPCGMLLLRDELTGWLATLDRQGREGERAFWLECWNGNQPFTIDRIGRGTVHVPACCMSLFGGIQPARLRSYLVDALRDGPANDGLIQRFQVVVWPDIPKVWKLVDRPPNAQGEATAARVFERLSILEPDPMRVLKFAPDAQQLFYDWLTKLETRLRSRELHPAMAAHLSKYRKLMPALALLFNLADWAAAGGNGPAAVSLDHARQAAAFCDDYLESHAARMYSCVTTPEVRAARELAQKLKRQKLPETFSLRDVYLKGWTGLGTPGDVRAALEILVDSNWVRELPAKPSPSGGRPSEQFQINPKVRREQMA